MGLRERKRAQTAETIVSVALRLFVDKGYAATTVDDIADAAVVSRATVFRYFPSKEEILFADFLAADDELCEACLNHKGRLSYGAAVRRAVTDFASSVVTSDSAMPERMAIIDSHPRLLSRSLLAEQQWAQTIVRVLGDPDPPLAQQVLAAAAMRAARVAMRQWGIERSGDFETTLVAALDVLRLPKR